MKITIKEDEKFHDLMFKNVFIKRAVKICDDYSAMVEKDITPEKLTKSLSSIESRRSQRLNRSALPGPRESPLTPASYSLDFRSSTVAAIIDGFIPNPGIPNVHNFPIPTLLAQPLHSRVHFNNPLPKANSGRQRFFFMV